MVAFARTIDDSQSNKNGTRSTPIATIRELLPFLKKYDPDGWKSASDKLDISATNTKIASEYWKTNLRFRLNDKYIPPCISKLGGSGLATKLMHSPLDNGVVCEAYQVLQGGWGMGSIDATLVESAIQDRMFEYLVKIRQISGIVPTTQNNQTLFSFTQSIFQNPNRLEVHGETAVFPKGKGPLYLLDIPPKQAIRGQNYLWNKTEYGWDLDIPFYYNQAESLTCRLQLNNGAITAFMSMNNDKKYGLSLPEYNGYHEFLYDVLQDALGIDYSSHPLIAAQFDINNDIPISQISPAIIELIEFALDNPLNNGVIKVEIEGMDGSFFKIYRVERALYGPCYRFEFCVRSKKIAEEFSILNETVSTIQNILSNGLIDPILIANGADKTLQEVIQTAMDPIPKYDRRINSMQDQLDTMANSLKGVVTTSAMAAEVSLQDGQLLRQLQKTVIELPGAAQDISEQQFSQITQTLQSVQIANEQRDILLKEFLSRQDKIDEVLELSETNAANITSILSEIRDFMKTDQGNQLVVKGTDEVMYAQRLYLDKVPVYKKYQFLAFKEIAVRKKAREEIEIDSDVLVDTIKYLETRGWQTISTIRKNLGRRREVILNALWYGTEIGLFAVDKTGRSHKYKVI